jgi:DNA-binding SARP family transcriptional activator
MVVDVPDSRIVTSGGVPQPVSGELIRPRLLDRLDERFSAAVTLVTAGPGFGKSTALAQAVRRHQLAPSGIDVWLSCAPGDEHAQRIGRRVHEALAEGAAWLSTQPAVDLEGDDPERIAAALIHQLVDCSPLQVCLVLDDCHLLGEGTSGSELLAAVVRGLPANGHLVLAGRTLPPLPLARLRAAEQVLTVHQDDLAFTPDEASAAAALVGRQLDADVGGWPAVVRLSLLAPPGSDRDYLAEEVLANLDQRLTDALCALSILGPATPDELASVLGEVPDMAALLALPLVSADATGRIEAHHLWHRPVTEVTAPDRLDHIRRRAADLLIMRRDFGRAGSVALAAGDFALLDRLALALVRTTMTAIPVETAARWVEAVPVAERGVSIRLLEALVRHTRTPHDPNIASLLDDVAAEAADVRPDVHAAALAVAALSAHAQADFGRLFSLAERARQLPETENLFVLQLLRVTLEAIACDLQGDPEGALAAMDELPWGEMARRDGNTAARLYLQAMWMSGEAQRAVEFAEAWYGGATRISVGSTLIGFARWFNGDPIGFPDPAQTQLLGDAQVNARDRFVGSSYATVMLASMGEVDRIEQLWATHDLASRAQPNARDSAHLANAMAARRLAAGDEAGAAAAIDDHFRSYPISEALGERHLRRWPALAYVLHPDARQAWDAASLGPAHIAARGAARTLLAARSGRVVEAPDLPVLYTQLPLFWSIELACRWQALTASGAVPLIAYLLDRAPEAANRELRRQAESSDAAVRKGALSLLRAIPSSPAAELAISVLGPVTLMLGGQRVEASELRRGRVRQLLAVLVVERTVRRDRAMELLWPDLGVDAASTNLRVTLTHLRKLLEPDRAAGEPGFHLRSDAITISLHASDRLWVDLWEADRLADQLRSTGVDTGQLLTVLDQLTSLLRGEPLSDLAEVPAYDPVREHLHLRHVAALLRLGELSLALGDAVRAGECAGRALELEPFDEQAHRLAIAAQLQRRDFDGTDRALARLRTALGELGVDAAPPTDVLTRSAEGWLQRSRGVVHQPVGMSTTSR